MAIAFDNVSQAINSSPSGSFNFAHTCSGENRIIFVQVFQEGNQSQPLSVTYNGIEMTEVNGALAGSQFRITLYYQLDPVAGGADVAVIWSGSREGGAFAVSYTGVNDLDTNVQHGSDPEGDSTRTETLTTGVDKCWTLLAWMSANSPTAGTGSTQRGTTITTGGGTPRYASIYDSNAAITPAGSTSMTIDFGSNGNVGDVMVSFTPSRFAKGDFFPFFLRKI